MKNIHILFLLSLLAFTGCRKANDLSTVDSKPTNNEGNMDLSVKPGDNFFMYCNGTWWNKTSLGTENFIGLMTEAQEISDKRLSSVTSASINKFENEVTNIDNTTVASIDFIKNNLKLVENINTEEEATDALVKTMLAGYNNLLQLDVYIKNRTGFQPTFKWSSNFHIDFNWVTRCMEELNISDASLRVYQASELYSRLMASKPSSIPTFQNMLDNPELRINNESGTTKANNNGIVQKVMAAYGLDPHNYVEAPSMVNFFGVLSSASPFEIQCLLQAYIVSDYRFTSRAAYNDYQRFSPTYDSFEKEINAIKTQKMVYLYAHAYTSKYVTPDLKAKMLTYCEDLRTAFRDRISRLEWMSQTTKQKAREKLDAMAFNVAYPEKWVDSGLPSLKGASLLEDILALNIASQAIMKDLTLKETKEPDFNYLLCNIEIESVNAAYFPYSNSINILPAWILEPLYNESLSDAHLYATLAVIGHEITHGFDSQGAKFSALGDVANWWTVSDQMEFNTRQQKLVDCYNNLEIMPAEMPGVYNNGKFTLSENMADLGGFLLSFDAYNSKLLSQGYKDEELQKQHKKFYQSYANLWRNKYSLAYASQSLIADEHSLPKERINGVVMNVDYWYDLYDVKWGDKLYLKPESRSSIW